jgi:hypothetical protein
MGINIDVSKKRRLFMTESKRKTVTVQRKITVMSIVTAKLKARYQAELEKDQAMIQSELDTITQEINTRSDQNDRVIKKHQLELTLKKIDQQRVEVRQLTMGECIPQEELMSHAVIGVGDNLKNKLQGIEIVVKDDVIQDIRTAGAK